MLHNTFLPSPVLRDYVKSFGIVHLVFPDKKNIPYKSYIPRPENSIEFFLRDPEYVEYPGEEKKKRSSAIMLEQHTILTNRYIGQDFLYFNLNFDDFMEQRFLKLVPDLIAKGISLSSPEAIEKFNELNERFGIIEYFERRQDFIDKYGLTN